MRSKRQVSAYRTKIHSYARSDAWKARSRRFRMSVGYKCAGCGKVNKANHAHHLTYSHAFTGREPDSDLMCLCSSCHRKVHDYAHRHRGLSLRDATYKALGKRRGFWAKLLGSAA